MVENNKDSQNASDIPCELPILPLRNTVAYPFLVIPLLVGIPRSVKLIEDVFQEDRMIGLVGMHDPAVEEPQPGQVHEIGCVAKGEHMVRMPDNNLQVIVHGLERFRVAHWIEAEPYLRVLLSSGYTDDRSRLAAIRQRGLSFIQKPYTVPDLLQAIRQALERRGAETSAS